MRKPVALLLLIMAIVVALALLRRPRPVENLPVASPAAAKTPIDSTPAGIARGDEPEEQPEALRLALARKKETGAKSEPPPPPPAPQPHFITVLDPDGAPVPNAVVFPVTHSYGNMAGSKVKEERTDDNGQLKMALGRNETAHYISYKVGVGSGVTGELRGDKDTTLKYEKSLTVAFKCVAPHGVALEGAEVILTTEVLLGTRRDAYGNETAIAIPLPHRMIPTDREGVSTFSAVLAPRLATAGWKAIPGLCHRVKATWYTMSAQAAIEKPPAGPVILVLAQ